MSRNETIVALSSALPGALGILRLSGDHAIQAVSTLFRPKSGKAFQDEGSRKLIFGTLLDQEGKGIDQVLATYSKGPNSYTGEDTAEVHCHGSPMVLTLALEAFYACGCRQALAGEFTKRAFLNGKLDLLQAEGVADLLDARNTAAVHVAHQQLEGRLTQKIEEIYGALSHLMAHFCVVLDYPDEEIDPFRKEEMESVILAQKAEIDTLLSTWQRGKHIIKGIPCALLGLPNAGKSSLLNALLGYERAIVTSIAGTTRDTIEGEFSLGNISLRLIDTAGLRETDDIIEQMGVARSRQAQEEASLHLVVIDGSEPLTGEEPAENPDIPCICILNKGDIQQNIDIHSLKYQHICQISTKTGEGLQELQNVISSIFSTVSNHSNDLLLTNLRQAQQLELAKQSLQGALEGLISGMAADGILSDVEMAMNELGELNGRNIPADITQEIFSRFCVGK
ncbi:MAG: tRNA uridine-5-carboxymethylaminomethyl(34) synthesis GTPase MnmE [Eubacteriales bacterium]